MLTFHTFVVFFCTWPRLDASVCRHAGERNSEMGYISFGRIPKSGDFNLFKYNFHWPYICYRLRYFPSIASFSLNCADSNALGDFSPYSKSF